MGRFALALLATLWLAAPAWTVQDTCTISDTGTWSAVATYSGSESCTGGDSTLGADDIIVIASGGDVTITGDITHDTTAGVKLTIESGGALTMQAADNGGVGACTTGACMPVLTLGIEGLQLEDGGTLTLTPLYRNAGAGTGAADTTLQTEPVQWNVPDVEFCPNPGGGADCGLLRFNFPHGATAAAIYDPDTGTGQPDPRWHTYLGALQAGEDVLCFWDFIQTDNWEPAEARWCYEVEAVTATCTTATDCFLDINLDQSALDQAGNPTEGYPTDKRDIGQLGLATDVVKGQCVVEVDSGSFDAEDATDQSWTGRFLQFNDGGGNPIQAAYPIRHMRNDVSCDGGDGLGGVAADDIDCTLAGIAVGTVDLFYVPCPPYTPGISEAHANTESVNVTYGIQTGDPFFIMVPPKIASATTTATFTSNLDLDNDSPISLDGTVNITGALIDAVGSQAGGPFASCASSAATVGICANFSGTWEHVWLRSCGTATNNHCVEMLAPNVTLGHTVISGGDPTINEGAHSLMYGAGVSNSNVEDWVSRHGNEHFAAFDNAAGTKNTVRRFTWGPVSQSATTVNGFAYQSTDIGMIFEDGICQGCTTPTSSQVFAAGGTNPTLKVSRFVSLTGDLPWTGFYDAGTPPTTRCEADNIVLLGAGQTMNRCNVTNAALVGNRFAPTGATNTLLTHGVYKNILVDDYRTSVNGKISGWDSGDSWENVLLIDITHTSDETQSLLEASATNERITVRDSTIAWRPGFCDSDGDGACDNAWGGRTDDGSGGVTEPFRYSNTYADPAATAPIVDGLLIFGHDRDDTTGFAYDLRSISAIQVPLYDANIDDPICMFDNGDDDMSTNANVTANLTKVVRGQPFRFRNASLGDFTPVKGSVADVNNCGAGRSKPPGVTRQMLMLEKLGLGPIYMGEGSVGGGGGGGNPKTY